jgi:ABC-2 type transport system permease protein
MQPQRPAEPAAVLHDIRYSRYAGQLRPRRAAVLSLARSSALRSLGIRRSAAAKIWPFVLVAAAFAPAVVAVGVPLILDRVGVQSPLDVLSYWQLLANVSRSVLLAYAASTIPNLLTRERRDRVLSLWFSTAVSPREYVVGKILAAVSLLLLVTLGPLLVEWLGGALVADAPLTWIRHNVDDLPRIVLACLLVALFHAAAALALGSLTPKRVFAVGGYIALILVPAVLGAVLHEITGQRGFLALVLVDVPLVVSQSVLRHTPSLPDEVAPVSVAWAVWALVTGVGLLTVALRYRRGDAA